MVTATGIESFGTLAQSSGLMLVSAWKPFLLLLFWVPWAWVVTKVYDKHAARFFLPRRRWNVVHLVAGTVAVLAALLMPIPGEAAFWVGLPVMILILGADLFAYAYVANKDERVPDRFKIRLNMESFRQSKADKEAAKLQAKVTLTIKGPDDKGKPAVLVPAPQAESPEYEVRIAAEAVYNKAMQARASQVDIGPAGKEGVYGVSLLVDGVRQPGETMPPAAAVKIMDFWKSAARLDLSDRRRKLQGMVSVEHDGVKHIARITSAGVQGGGMRLTMLFDPEQAVIRKPSELGLLDMQMAELKAVAAETKGIVLLAAPSHGGRTTLTYSVAQLHDAYTSNVQTVEPDPQAALEGVRLNKFEAEKEGAEFSTLVRSVLRRDPQVVLVSDLVDPNTAKEITKADLERTRVYVSLRADSAMAALEVWLRAVGDPAAGAKRLEGVVVGRLLRKLCTNCRVGYPPSAEMLKKLGLPPDKIPQLFKKGGQVLIKNKPEICPMCSGAGYMGQEGIFEVYKLDSEDRAMLSGGNLAGLKAALRKKQQPTIQQSAIRKAVDGTTSVEEVMRVTAPAAAAAPRPAPAASSAPQPQRPAPAPSQT